MKFQSDLQEIKKLKIPQDCDVRKLPQLWRCGPEFIQDLRNPLLNQLLEEVPKHPEYRYLSVDSRTHMLYKDFYPNIPGWHCDDFYRTETTLMQPDLENVGIEAQSIHYMLLIGDASLTEFLDEDIELPSVREMLDLKGTEKPVYYYYDEMIEQEMAKRPLATRSVEDRTLYRFGPLCFHRGQGATKNGWRYFIRLTFSNHYEPKNELRYQTQVYTRERVSW